MESSPVDEETLDRLMLLEQGDPSPWKSYVEGRDHLSGDTFIMVGPEDDRRQDLYLTRDNAPADAATYDLIAEARNALPNLIREIRRLRGQDS